MPPTADFSKTSGVDTSNDHVVIQNLIEDIPGGKTLDVAGVAEEVLNAGHIVIEETSSGNLKPLGVSGGAYVALPAGHTYKGVLVASIPTDRALASILVRGTVNETASPFAVPAGAKTALPLIRFVND